jgi:hypothetical protein
MNLVSLSSGNNYYKLLQIKFLCWAFLYYKNDRCIFYNALQFSFRILAGLVSSFQLCTTLHISAEKYTKCVINH